MTTQSVHEHAEQLNDLLSNSTIIAQKTYEIISEFIRKHPTDSLTENLGSMQELTKLYQKYLHSIWSDPSKLIDIQLAYWQDMLKLWQSSTQAWLGMPAAPVITPNPGDKRFKNAEWDSLPLFAFIKQGYLLYAEHVLKMVNDLQGVDEKTAQQLAFYLKQHVDALSPSNFIVTNPDVLQATIKSGGQNLINGLNNMLQDLSKSPAGMLRISMTDMTAFKVGENLAVTPGKVIFQNDMMQLIQYAPTTKTVFARPVLIVPPWINKFYILDLKPENSLVKYLVDSGMTVFLISWINPKARHRDKSFGDYMQEGILAAIEAMQKITGEKTVNAIGYCLGGTLLSGTLAYLAAKKQKLIESATYMATLIDFRDPGEMSVFIDEPQIQALEERMSKQGFLDGSQMSTTFNLLRSNELIWSFFINNYLLGREPFPFDLLYWNCDNTNLPYKMHSFYLRKMYLENRFCQPNGVELNGVPIDIHQITVPAFFISTQEDHIAPWRSTYYGALLHQGPTEFVLGGSGHVAGIVNPPQKKKYGYWTNKKLAADPDQWLANAKENEGSWWTYWSSWAEKYAGEKVEAKQPGKGPLKALQDAPGSYVLENYSHK